MWVLRLTLWLKRSLHKRQAYGFSPVCILKWLFKRWEEVHFLPQKEQESFGTSCKFMCDLRFCFVLNVFWHLLQENGLAVLWVTAWILTALWWTKVLPHSWQANCLFCPCVLIWDSKDFFSKNLYYIGCIQRAFLRCVFFHVDFDDPFEKMFYHILSSHMVALQCYFSCVIWEDLNEKMIWSIVHTWNFFQQNDFVQYDFCFAERSKKLSHTQNMDMFSVRLHVLSCDFSVGMNLENIWNTLNTSENFANPNGFFGVFSYWLKSWRFCYKYHMKMVLFSHGLLGVVSNNLCWRKQYYIHYKNMVSPPSVWLGGFSTLQAAKMICCIWNKAASSFCCVSVCDFWGFDCYGRISHIWRTGMAFLQHGILHDRTLWKLLSAYWTIDHCSWRMDFFVFRKSRQLWKHFSTFWALMGLFFWVNIFVVAFQFWFA